jgi:outer membrane protein OmpA-like peptidoglycan-associated protein
MANDDLAKFEQGANILQQVDVSEIFTSLALGIAEAQQKLDDNSVAQIIRLSETEVAGKSLLELGFVPAFYSFAYADISAKINLKMALKETFDLGIKFDISIASSKGYTEKDQTFIKEDKYEHLTSQNKSSKTLTTRAKEKSSVKIENKSFSMNENMGCFERVEDFKENILNQTSISDVYSEVLAEKITENVSVGCDVWIENGYLTVEEGIEFDKTGVGILKITNYNDDTIDVNGEDPNTGIGGNFDLTTDMAGTIGLAHAANLDVNNGAVFGITKTGQFFYRKGNDVLNAIDSTFYFLHDDLRAPDKRRRGADIIYDQDLKVQVNGVNDFGQSRTNLATNHKLIHQALRFIKKAYPAAVITITGHTDASGGEKYNSKLSDKRAKALKSHIFGDDVTIDMISKGESAADQSQPTKPKSDDRKATITLDADYIIFVDGKITVAAIPAIADANKPNKFVFLEDYVTDSNKKLKFKYGVEIFQLEIASDYTAVKDYVKTKTQSFIQELRYDRTYSLHNEAVVKYYFFSKDSKEISIEHSKETSEDANSTQDSFMSTDTVNSQSKMNDNVKENSKNNSFAMNASLDLRMSKQFEMSMEGSASMSARLVAVPAPEAFIIHIKNPTSGQ